VGLAHADDDTVWSYAKDQGLEIVSKDSDFHQRSFVLGFPPKVVWIRRGNCTTSEIANLLQAYQSDLLVFAGNSEAAFLELG
jgi:predicted nuclease of predicted toxin-antitoxin system